MKEYPHTDFLERGDELLDILVRTARGEVKPVASVHDLRMLVPFRPTREPARGLVDKIKTMEGKDGILSVSFGHGFPWSDVPDVGAKFVVVADGDSAKAKALASKIKELEGDVTKGKTVSREKIGEIQKELDSLLQK